MKKIIFSDKYNLTHSVLDGRKTMTRRIIEGLQEYKGEPVRGFRVTGAKDIRLSVEMHVYDESCDDLVPMYIQPKYKVGEVVAVAQSYEAVYHEQGLETLDMLVSNWKNSKGWRNHMLVRTDLMPHHIRITNIKVEQLQDISDEDCLKEGVEEHLKNVQYGFPSNIGYCGQYPFPNPREAFARLIDKVSGKGTWDSNPFVFAYEFELID